MFKPNLWKLIDESGNVSIPQNLTVAGTVSVNNTVSALNIPPIANLSTWTAAGSILRSGQAATPSPVVAYIGDSLVEGGRTSAVLRTWMQQIYGDGGFGWIPFYSQAGAGALVTVTPTGSWTNRNGHLDPAALGPDMYDSTTSDTVTPAQYTVALNRNVDNFVMYYSNAPTGSFRWKIDAGGGWTTVNNTGANTIGTVVAPTTLAAHTFYVQIVSGTIDVIGVDAQVTTQPGARLHGLGVSGSYAQQWNAVAQPQWQTSIAGLGVQSFVVQTGINDAHVGRTAAQYIADLTTLASNILAAVPTASITFVMEPQLQNTTDNAFLTSYLLPLYNFCATNGYGLVDAMTPFGTYAAALTNGLQSGDGVHPSVAGGWQIATYEIPFFNLRWVPPMDINGKWALGYGAGYNINSATVVIQDTRGPNTSLLIKGHSGQASTDFFTIQDSSANYLFRVSAPSGYPTFAIANATNSDQMNFGTVAGYGGFIGSANAVPFKLRTNNTIRYVVASTGETTMNSPFVSTGMATSTEGGCAANTDLVVDGTTNTKVASASYTFVAADVGGWIQITAGTGFTVGRYQISTVAAGAATLDRSPGAVGITGGSYSVNRGRMIMVQGAAGVLDTFRICRKDAANAYAWTALY